MPRRHQACRSTNRATDQIRACDQPQDRKGARFGNSTDLARPRRRGDRMIRREFISLLGGTAAWPLTARAQHPGKLPTIGFLGTTDPSTMRPWITAFVQRLRDLGWIEDRTIAIAYRWAEGHPERYAEIAAEFVRLNVNVIVTTGPAAPQAKKATSVISIVLALSGDPVGAGLVASLAQPG